MARFMREFEVEAVKVKVGTSLEANRELLGIARRILGEGVSLRIDANCAWSSDEAIRQLEALAEFDLHGVEQPLPAKDLAGMAEVTAAGLVPVVADESLCSLADAEALIRARGCDVFNIRIAKCGGIINAGRIHRRAQAAGLRCQLGAQVGETGILSAAGRHYATRCAPIVWLEGSYGELLLERDLTEPSVTVGKGGRAAALHTPGLGVAPAPRWLEAYTLEVLPLG
jgi:muconate cycloisomerase